MDWSYWQLHYTFPVACPPDERSISIFDWPIFFCPRPPLLACWLQLLDGGWVRQVAAICTYCGQRLNSLISMLRPPTIAFPHSLQGMPQQVPGSRKILTSHLTSGGGSHLRNLLPPGLALRHGSADVMKLSDGSGIGADRLLLGTRPRDATCGCYPLALPRHIVSSEDIHSMWFLCTPWHHISFDSL